VPQLTTIEEKIPPKPMPDATRDTIKQQLQPKFSALLPFRNVNQPAPKLRQRIEHP
jgi:hypothetical protein